MVKMATAARWARRKQLPWLAGLLLVGLPQPLWAQSTAPADPPIAGPWQLTFPLDPLRRTFQPSTPGRVLRDFLAPPDDLTQRSSPAIVGLGLMVSTDPAPELKTPLPPEQLAKLKADLRQMWSKHPTPGLALTVIDRQGHRFDLLLGTTDLSTGEEISANTLFNLGAATQGLTSILALRLAESGQINLDASLRSRLPDLHLTDPQATQTLTLRHLLSNVGGIPAYFDDILDPAWAQPQDLLQTLSQTPITAQPGRLLEPSALGFSTAAYLLEEPNRAPSANALDRFKGRLAELVLEPLGLTSATFTLPVVAEGGGGLARENAVPLIAESFRLAPGDAVPGVVVEGPSSRGAGTPGAVVDEIANQGPGRGGEVSPLTVARPHRWDARRGYQPVRRWEPPGNPFSPALGLKATLSDVAAWLLVELRYGQLPDGSYLAGPTAFRERWWGRLEGGPRVGPRAALSVGMGWVPQTVSGVEILSIRGSYDRQWALIAIVPSAEVALGLLINAEGPHAEALIESTLRNLPIYLTAPPDSDR